MSFSNDAKKLLITELKAGKQLNLATWQQVGGPWSTSYDSPDSIIYCQANCFGKLYVGANNGNIYVFDGASWSVSYAATGYDKIESLCVHNGALFATCRKAGYIRVITTADGINWTVPGSDFTDVRDYSCSLTSYAGDLYILYGWINTGTGNDYSKFSSSSDNGATWNNKATIAYLTAPVGAAMVVFDSCLYFGLSYMVGYIYKWNGAALATVYNVANGYSFSSAFVYDGKIYFGRTDGKVLQSSDGAIWVEVKDFGAGTVHSFTEYGAKLLAAYDDKIYETVDGINWILFYDSAEAAIYTIGLFGNSLYVGTGTAGKVLVCTTIAWQCDFAYGEISELQVDGAALTKETTYAACEAAADSFFHDFFAGILYVHLTGGYDPGEYISPDYTYDVIAYVWKCLSNRQGENGETIDFIPEGCTYPHYYEPALRPGTLSELSATIADHFESAMQTSFGNLAIVNDLARWYADIDDWYWSNGDVRVRVGEMGNTYAQLDKIFVGKMKNPVVSDIETTFQLFDAREGRLQSIPPDHYSLTDYPSMDTGSEGQPIPILFGEKKNITPACINTYISPGGRTFKISATHFNSGADVFEMQSVDAVYHKGITLSLATHYTIDLHNGEFTLLFDPGDGDITCDAKGIKNGFDFSASPFGAATGVYSENVADHLFFILHILNGIPEAELNMLSFYELQTARTQKVAWLLDQDTATMDFNRLLQQTSLYHFLPLVDGTFAARYYRKSVPTGTLELRDYDHKDFKKERPDEGVFRDIFLKYAKDPTTGVFKQLVHTEARTQQRYKTKESYTVGTALRDDTEAAAVLAFYVALLKSPPTKIETSISMIGRLLIPTDKLYMNRKVQADGQEVIISADDIYVILEARKNLSDGRVFVKGQLDTQLAIYTNHADSPHEDVPHADHSDAIHEDADHGDSHTDAEYTDHDDSTHDHEDVPHVDEYAIHEDHDDHPWPHEDGTPHNDTPHEDYTYSDHGDVPYADIPHVDTSHVDHDDTIHTDAHTDISHIDSEV